ncbi:PREDICTED: uncharacterized protein LOC104821460 isoform X2 [Tarenaya hassleriana]|uniref:uncharacterized protein LOC104821460 isoform X2 n=1 Tax=Tarenaya hassleriana TaxID=28532 RepID=UPI00053C6EFC|nr:PREDICTED: uncharacterized protein LOC104821460 isoform X2 [Tarenaya hassleriana]
MSTVEPELEDLFLEKKRVRNPLVPVEFRNSPYHSRVCLHSHTGNVFNWRRICLCLHRSHIVSHYNSRCPNDSRSANSRVD